MKAAAFIFGYLMTMAAFLVLISLYGCDLDAQEDSADEFCFTITLDEIPQGLSYGLEDLLPQGFSYEEHECEEVQS